MNTRVRIRRSGTVVALAVPMLLGAWGLLPAAGAERADEAAPPPVKQSEPELAASAPDGPRKLRFRFSAHPWKDVIEWFARQADLSLVTDHVPQGTFSYVDDRAYTPAEAIDLLNSVLLTKGYTLVRRDRMLMLINAEEVPPNLVPVIPLEQLDERGEFELVSVLFNLAKLSPEEAKQEIEGLLGPQGKVVALSKSQQIQVTETAGRLRAIRSVIQRIEGSEGFGTGALRSFALKFATPEEVLAVMRPLLNVPEEEFIAADGSIRLAVDPAGGRLLATGKPDKLAQVEEILKAIDVGEAGEPGTATVDEAPQLVIYPITTADPQTVLAVLQTLLAGLPDVRLATDPKTGSLVALARPSEHANIIQPTLEQYEGSARLMEVIQLRTVEPQKAVLLINKLFGGGGEEPNPNAPQVDADPTTRQLVVRGTASQIEQIHTLLEKMGEADTTEGAVAADRNVRMVPLGGRAARAALEQLQQFWPAVRHNRIRVVTPSAVIPTIRSGGPAGGPESDQPKTETTRPAPEEPPREPAAVERRPSSDKAAGASRRARVFLAAQTTETGPRPDEPAAPPSDREPGPQPDQPAPPSPEPAAPLAEPAPPSPGSPEAAPGTPKEPAPIIVAPMAGGVMIASQDAEALDDFEQLLTTLAGGTTTGVPELTIFYLKHAKATVVAETINQVLAGGSLTGASSGGSTAGDLASAALGQAAGGILGALLDSGGGTIAPSGPIRVTPDTRLNALVVQASPVDLEIIEQLLRILDQKESPEEILVVPKAKIIPVLNTQAERVAEILREVYRDRLITGAGSDGRTGRPTPEQVVQMLRGRRGSSRGGTGGTSRGAAEQVQKMSIGVDAATNSIVVSAPEPLLEEVERLVGQLDRLSLESNSQTVVTKRLHRTSPAVVQSALTALMGEAVRFGGASGGSSRSQASSAGRPSPSTSSSPEASDAARRAVFIEMMRRRFEGTRGRGRPSGRGDSSRPARRGGSSGSPGGASPAAPQG